MAHAKSDSIASRCHSRMKWCEVVRVDSPIFLVSSRQLACHYETTDGEPLAIGYYLALWPLGACRSSYGRELRYFGPFASQILALLLQTSALGLGILELKTGNGHAAITKPPALKHRRQPSPPPDSQPEAGGAP